MNDFLRSLGYADWILPALLAIPVVGGLAIWIVGAAGSKPAEQGQIDEVASGVAGIPRGIALVTLLAEFILSLGLWWSVAPSVSTWQSRVDWPWIPSWGIRFTIGLDGIA